MNKNFELIFVKKGKDYFTFLDLDETILLIKEYYKKYKKCEAEVRAISCIAGCGENPETDKPIIKGDSAFSVRYNAGVHPKTGKTIIKEEWFEESNLKDKFNELFRTYGYEIKDIVFHTDLYLKFEESSAEENNCLISEEMAPNYDENNLRSTPAGISILFRKKNTIFKKAVLSFKKNKSKKLSKI